MNEPAVAAIETGPHADIGILGGIVLAACIGAAIGLIARPLVRIRRLGIPGHVAAGVFGSLTAGFVLPALHFDVSRSLGEGIMTSAIGAALALAASMLLLGREG